MMEERKHDAGFFAKEMNCAGMDFKAAAVPTYGVPYQGSKSTIAARIVDILPRADVLVDLFAGGCAVTHAALLSGKWRRVLANDISDVPGFFADAMNGAYKDERRWISRADFETGRDSDPYIRCCWSFGSGLLTYIYGRDIEPFKKAGHCAIMLDDWRPLRGIVPSFCAVFRRAMKGEADIERRRRIFTRTVDFVMASSPESQCLARLRTMQNIQNIQRLNRINALASLRAKASLSVSRGDYRDAEIPPGSVVYCDPPYITRTMHKNQYNCDFDQAAFLDWVRTRDFPVYVSEYSLPDDFVPVAEWKKVNSFCATRTFVNIEKVFVHKRFAGSIMGRFI